MDSIRYILQLQRNNRKNPTPAEAMFWEAIRGKKLGVRFLRQHDFGRYIADFYCSAALLVVELDGSVHDSLDAREYDAIRTKVIESRGLLVTRYRNEQVLNNLDVVLAELHLLIQSRLRTDKLQAKLPLSRF